MGSWSPATAKEGVHSPYPFISKRIGGKEEGEKGGKEGGGGRKGGRRKRRIVDGSFSKRPGKRKEKKRGKECHWSSPNGASACEGGKEGICPFFFIALSTNAVKRRR